MTEITAQPPEMSQVGMLPAAAKPPDGEFAERLSQAQSSESRVRSSDQSTESRSEKVANTQSNTASQNPDSAKANQAQGSNSSNGASQQPSGKQQGSGKQAAVSVPGTQVAGPQAQSASLPTSAIPVQATPPQAVPAVVVLPVAPPATPEPASNGNSQPEQASSTPAPQVLPNPATSASLTSAMALQVAVSTPQPKAVSPSSTVVTVQPAAVQSAVVQTATAVTQSEVDETVPTPVAQSATPNVVSGMPPRATQDAESRTPAANQTSVLTVDSIPNSGSQDSTVSLPTQIPGPQKASSQATPNAASQALVNLNSLKDTFSDIVSVRSFRETQAAPEPTPLSDPSAVQAASTANEAATNATAQAVPMAAVAATTDQVQTATPKGAGNSAAKPAGASAAPSTQAAAKDDALVVVSNPSAGQAGSDSSDDSDFEDAATAQQPISVRAKSQVGSSDADIVPTAAPSQTQAATGTAQATDVTSSTGNVDKTQLASQVADHIQLLAVTQQKEGVVVHLEPADLGSITLVVRTVASNVSAQVSASDDHVRTALEQSRDQLGQQLQVRGYHLTSISVGSSSSSAGVGSDSSKNGSTSPGLQQGTQQQAQQQQARSSTSFANRTALPAEAVASTSRTSSSTSNGLDVWI